MDKQQILEIAKEVGQILHPPKSSVEKWYEWLKIAVYVVSIVVGIMVWQSMYEQRQQDEMIKAYFSGQQSKYAQMIGVLEGQGHRDLADILKIMKAESEDNFYRNIKFEKVEEK